jgi:RNA polymerase sigma-70 factor, ECF subfamily
MSDGELLWRITGGEETALLELHRRYVNLVFSIALHVLHDHAAAEEVVQDVFLAVWRRAATYDPARGTVGTWLITLGRYRAIDHLRRQQRQPLVAHDMAEQPTDEAALDADHLDLQQALCALPAEQRACLDLIYFGGLTHYEVAERLQVPLGTVKSRVRLALERLRRALLVLGLI